jgi:hypothetical protein
MAYPPSCKSALRSTLTRLFLELVSNAIIADDTIRGHQESKKKKVLATPSDSAPHKYRMVCAPHYHPPQHHHHQLVIHPTLHQNVMPRVVAPPLAVPHPPTQKVGVASNTCYNYVHVGHFVRDCTALRLNYVPCFQSHSNHLPRGPTKVVSTRIGRVNYKTVEDVPEGEQVLVCTFSLNGHPIIILFDSCAFHDFISKACTQKCQLVFEHMSTPYMILTLVVTWSPRNWS